MDRVRLGGPVSANWIAGVGQSCVHALVEPVGHNGQVRGAELVDDRPDPRVGEPSDRGEVAAGGLAPQPDPFRVDAERFGLVDEVVDGGAQIGKPVGHGGVLPDGSVLDWAIA